MRAWFPALCAAVSVALAACGPSGAPGNGLVPANPSAAQITLYSSVPVRSKKATLHIATSVVSINDAPSATALARALDGLRPTGRRCSPADPYLQAIFFSTPPGRPMIATIIDIDTKCGTVARPVAAPLHRAFRETPALAAQLAGLVHDASSVDGGPRGARAGPNGAGASGTASAPASGVPSQPGSAGGSGAGAAAPAARAGSGSGAGR